MHIKKLVIIVILVLWGCSPDVEVTFDNLAADIEASGLTVQRDNVIACAASSPDDSNEILIFFYPRPGAQNFKLYGSIDTNLDKNDFNNYQFIADQSNDVFGGSLQNFILGIDEEVWVIVSFEENGEIHTSTPIRLKQNNKPTLWTDQIIIDQSATLMPIFSWEEQEDTAIYFQVVSDAADDFISGTYTNDTFFQYYKLNNVVLNVTQGSPPDLVADDIYNITVMAVSIDNWVNTVFQDAFIAE